jgi:hypothetical protein
VNDPPTEPESVIAPVAVTAISSDADADADSDAGAEAVAVPAAAISSDADSDADSDAGAEAVAVPAPDAGRVLAVALDLHPPSASERSWIAPMVQTLVERAGGSVVLDFSRGPVGGPRATSPGEIARRIDLADLSSPGALPALVTEALAGLREVRDRACLILVTDGLGAAGGAGWREARRAAGDAGIPILAAGIWSEGFDPGLRNDLRRLAEASGGEVFFLQGPADSGGLLERFGSVVDGLGPDHTDSGTGDR